MYNGAIIEMCTKEAADRIEADVNKALDKAGVKGVARDLLFEMFFSRISVENGREPYITIRELVRDQPETGFDVLPRAAPVGEAIAELLSPNGREAKIRERMRVVHAVEHEKKIRGRAEIARIAAENAKAAELARKADAWMSLTASERASIRLAENPSATLSEAFKVMHQEETKRTLPPTDWTPAQSTPTVRVEHAPRAPKPETPRARLGVPVLEITQERG